MRLLGVRPLGCWGLGSGMRAGLVASIVDRWELGSVVTDDTVRGFQCQVRFKARRRMLGDVHHPSRRPTSHSRGIRPSNDPSRRSSNSASI